MVDIILYSRRDLNGDWHIRNRMGRYERGSREYAAARKAAETAQMRWHACEPATEFRIEDVEL